MIVTKECLFCGTILDEGGNNPYICNDCSEKLNILNQITKVDKAREKISKSTSRYLGKEYSYKNERDLVVAKMLNKELIFKSSEEICFALQLEREKIRYFSNYKIGKYAVDFFLPDMRKIIEIDSELYHKNKNKDFIRERSIMLMVGEEYEIVRFQTTAIPNYITNELKDIINFIVEKRNFDGRFRDTRWDKEYLFQYFDLKSHIERGKK